MSVSESTVAVDPCSARWRTVALVGTGLAILLALIQSGSVTENDLGFAVWIVLAWALALGFLFPQGRRLLWARPEILAPVGIVLPIDVMIRWLSVEPKLEAMMKPLATISLWGIGASLSLPFMLSAVLWSAFAAWQTDLLARGMTEPGSIDLSPGAPLRRGFWRAFGALAVGQVGLSLLSMPVLHLFGSDGNNFEGFAFFLTLVLWLWNVATFALVPYVLLSPEPFTVAVAAGFRWARSNKLLFSRLVILQLALMGAWTYFATWGNKSFNVHGFWIGGYESHCHWYTDHTKWVRGGVPSPFVSAVLEGMFLILAVAVKQAVVASLFAKPAVVPGKETSPEGDATEPI